MIKLNGPLKSLRKKSQLEKSSLRTKSLTQLESQEEEDKKELPPDGEYPDSQESPIEVLERSLVLDHGIQLPFNGLYQELVKMDISIEPT